MSCADSRPRLRCAPTWDVGSHPVGLKSNLPQGGTIREVRLRFVGRHLAMVLARLGGPRVVGQLLLRTANKKLTHSKTHWRGDLRRKTVGRVTFFHIGS